MPRRVELSVWITYIHCWSSAGWNNATYRFSCAGRDNENSRRHLFATLASELWEEMQDDIESFYIGRNETPPQCDVAFLEDVCVEMMGGGYRISEIIHNAPTRRTSGRQPDPAVRVH